MYNLWKEAIARAMEEFESKEENQLVCYDPDQDELFLVSLIPPVNRPNVVYIGKLVD